MPIVKTQTLQGGTENIGGGVKRMVGALNGETLTKTPQKVPGGILGLVECDKITGEGFWEKLERGMCEFFFENKYTGVEATTELAAPASSVTLDLLNAEIENGTALTLPIKVKLENPLLGNECYIGSNSNPITLHLTSGTSGSVKAIRGARIKGRRRHPRCQIQHARRRHLLSTRSHRLRRILLVPTRPNHQLKNSGSPQHQEQTPPSSTTQSN